MGRKPALWASEVHASILGVRLACLGDLLLDVIVVVDGPLVAGDDRPATTRVGAGGQAANVAAWAASLGADAHVVVKRGADAAATLLAAELATRGVRVVGPAEGGSGVVVSISGGGDRALASDRGSAVALRAGELDPAWFDCDRLHVSGYALAADPIATAALRAARLARAGGASVSLDLASSRHVDERFRRRVEELDPDTVFATEREGERFGALPPGAVVKRGAAGVRIDGIDYPAAPTELLDTTGAGDAFAAGYLVGGVELGLRTAARCCARLGSLP